MGVIYSQSVPPTPVLTERNLPSQVGKVFIVTGGTSGVGYELCRILYHAGGKVYLAGRSRTNADAAISSIKAQPGESALPGELHFLEVSLDDLTTIKPAVDHFTSREARLDVLFNNAGVAGPPKGSLSAQGHDLTLATNCLGHYLLTQLLLPTLRTTAQQSPPGAVRVIWTSSIVVDLHPPALAKFRPDRLAALAGRNPQLSYELSKTGNWFLATALAAQLRASGDGTANDVLSVTQNPGNLQSKLVRHFSPLTQRAVRLVLHPAVYGAYTELWAGLAPELGVEHAGAYVVPWGRLHPRPVKNLLRATKSRAEGGTGEADMFAEWCEEQTAQFR